MRKCGLILALLILTGLAGWGIQPPQLPSPPLQKVTVCPEGPPKCDFTSIEAATGLVAGGGIIKVLPGVYTENIEIGKSLTLQGTTGVTIIAKDPEQPAIYVNPRVKNVTIANLIITGSDKAGIEVDERAKGIAIKGNWIQGRETGLRLIEMNGIGLQIKPHAQATVEGNTFAAAIGVAASAAKVNIINNNFFSSLNIAVTGGEVNILQSKIYGGILGGGILIEGAPFTPIISANIEDNVISGAYRGLEIRPGRWGAVRLNRNILIGNILGGVIWVRSLEAQGNYILNGINTNSGISIAPEEGQGLIILATEKIDLEGNIVIGNDSSGLILGLSQTGAMKVEWNIILNNGGYGLALLDPDCISTYVKELLGTIIPEEEWDEVEDKLYEGQLQGKVEGSDNFIAGNKEGDLCPPDYPWPEGFVKGSGNTGG